MSKGTDGRSHLAAERTSTTARDGGDDIHTTKGKTRTANAEHDKHARTVRAGRSGRHTGDKPDQLDGDPTKYADWSFKLTSFLGCHGSAVSARVDEEREREIVASAAKKAHSALRCTTFEPRWASVTILA